MEEKKEANSRRRRRRRGIRNYSFGTKRDGLDLPEFSSGVQLLSVEVKVDTAGVSYLDDDFFPAADGARAAGLQSFPRDGLAVGGDRDPGFFAGLDEDGKFARSCGGGGGRQILRCQIL